MVLLEVAASIIIWFSCWFLGLRSCAKLQKAVAESGVCGCAVPAQHRQSRDCIAGHHCSVDIIAGGHGNVDNDKRIAFRNATEDC
jgi:hypothetical protein